MARNTYPGVCYRCGEQVAPLAGHFEKIPGGWRVQHAECAIKYRGSKGPLELEIDQWEMKAKQSKD